MMQPNDCLTERYYIKIVCLPSGDSPLCDKVFIFRCETILLSTFVCALSKSGYLASLYNADYPIIPEGNE